MEIWKDINDWLEVSSLGRVRSKIITLKGEFGEGLKIIPPKYLPSPKELTWSISIVKGKATVYLKESYIQTYAKLFKLKKEKKHRWARIDSNKPVSVDNIEGVKKGPKPKGENPESYEKLRRNIAAFKKDNATGMISLTNFN